MPRYVTALVKIPIEIADDGTYITHTELINTTFEPLTESHLPMDNMIEPIPFQLTILPGEIPSRGPKPKHRNNTFKNRYKYTKMRKTVKSSEGADSSVQSMAPESK
jgi:hypothetical protein